jgi:hypothetical protein
VTELPEAARAVLIRRLSTGFAERKRGAVESVRRERELFEAVREDLAHTNLGSRLEQDLAAHAVFAAEALAYFTNHQAQRAAEELEELLDEAERAEAAIAATAPGCR